MSWRWILFSLLQQNRGSGGAWGLKDFTLGCTNDKSRCRTQTMSDGASPCLSDQDPMLPSPVVKSPLPPCVSSGRLWAFIDIVGCMSSLAPKLMCQLHPLVLAASINVPPKHPSGVSCVCVLSRFSCVRFRATPWTIALQTPLSMGLSRQEYWSWIACPPPGDFPDPGIEPTSLPSPALTGQFFTSRTTCYLF